MNDNNEFEVYLLAVYGTLKQNFPNYYFYLHPKEPIYKGFVDLPYQMYTKGDFPILYPSIEFHSIYIEVFEINQKTMRKIDNLEGVPIFYTRRIEYIKEIQKEVFLYIIENQNPEGELIESGIFQRERG